MASTIKAGNATTGLAMSSDGTGILNILTGSGSGTNAVTVDASQNVGIGTTPSAWNSSAKAIDIATGSSLVDYTAQTWLANNLYLNSSAAWIYKTTNASSLVSQTGGQIIFYRTASGTAGGTATLLESMRIDGSSNLQFNSGYGSVATAYGCRAWVNFNGTGTVAIRASGNVTSITDNAAGDYTVNFTTAMPDANYSLSIASSPNYGTNIGNFMQAASTATTTEIAPTTSAFRFAVFGQNTNPFDSKYIFVAFFR
jgi:hypothetical protein